jgi:hypothetical protein
MCLFKLNTMILALIFSFFIEAISTRVYYWASTFSPDTFEGTLCDFFLVVHMPAVKLVQMFYPASQWPGVGAYFLFYVFAFCECWILTFAVIWILRRFYKRSDDKSRAT